MPRLSEHERSGAIGMLKAGVRDSGVARYYKGHSSAIQHLRDFTRLLEQLKVDTRLANKEWRPIFRRQLTSIISTIFASTISVPAGYKYCQTNSRAPRVTCFRFLIKIFYCNNFESCPISRQISNCSLL